jgi:hypothetical protein
MYVVFGADEAASASQSCAPPGPPASVTVTLAPPTTLVVLTDNVGAAAELMANGTDAEVPADVENTLTCAVPADAISAAAMAACSCVESMNVVGLSEPFHRTTDVALYPAPLTLSVNAGPPAVALDGDNELIVGPPPPLVSTVTVGLVAARV